MTKKRKIVLLVDGYNLYNGINDLEEKSSPDAHHYLKWLDLRKISEQFINSDKDEISEIIYFTAYADHQRERERNRQRLYIKVLKNLGIKIVFGVFKRNRKKCPHCGKRIGSPQEKQTDVNIAIHILRLAHQKNYDELLLVTGDSDIVPAITEAKTIHPNGHIRILFPPNRVGNDIQKAADGKTSIKRTDIEKALLPEKIKLKNGKTVTRPEKYNP